MLKTFDKRGTDERKKGTGKNQKKLSKSEVKKLVKSVNHKTGCSQRKLAKKFKVSAKRSKRKMIIAKESGPQSKVKIKKNAQNLVFQNCVGVFLKQLVPLL